MSGSDVSEYEWIVIFGGFIAFFAAFGIGANDVANAYATSVGSKALTIMQACFLAVIFEFLGAFLAGGQVAKTIRKGIAEVDCFEGEPEVLMYGNLMVILAVSVWLIFATKYEMPVSTTHSCIGGVIGMTIVAKGSGCVVWFKEGDEDNLYLPKGVVAIVLSWIFSPVLSGMFAALLYFLIRKFILRASNSFQKAKVFYPLLVFVAVMLNVFFIISKGIDKRICKKSKEAGFLCKEEDGKPLGKVDPGAAMWLSVVVAVGTAILCFPLYTYIKNRVETRMANPGACSSTSSSTSTSSSKDAAAAAVETGEGKAGPQAMGDKIKNALMYSLKADVHAAASGDASTAAVHANAEKFDRATEMYFEYIQIFTAIVDSFAHGANDVANAMGPFMAIYAINKTGKVTSSATAAEDDAQWILALGGIGIGVGLCLYGYQIIRAIGVKLAVITPPRGVSIELGSATVIIMGSYLGLPLSTTHCQVGATTGVALLEGTGGVNYWVLGKAVVGWVITLIVVGFTSGLLVAQGIHAPLAEGPTRVLLNEDCPSWATGHGWRILNGTNHEYPF